MFPTMHQRAGGLKIYADRIFWIRCLPLLVKKDSGWNWNPYTWFVWSSNAIATLVFLQRIVISIVAVCVQMSYVMRYDVFVSFSTMIFWIVGRIAQIYVEVTLNKRQSFLIAKNGFLLLMHVQSTNREYSFMICEE